ncbi:MAG: hypothetical protein ACRDMJ_07030 [Solirubrobacteraceae bacterium]
MSFGDQPSEDELRAAYEAEIKRIRVEQIVLEQVVSLVNLGMRRTGLAPGTEDERDLAQVRVAIEAVRALLPLIEQTTPQQAPAIREALSQMQLTFVRLGGAPDPSQATDAGTAAASPAAPAPPSGAADQPPPTAEPPKPGEPGPAQRSGRLWIPGQ